MSIDGSATLSPRSITPELLLEDVRKRLMNSIVLVVALVGVPVMAASLHRAADIGFRPAMVVQIGAVVVFLVLATLRERLPFGVMAGTLFFLIPVNAVVALLAFGLIGHGILMILVWATVVSIFSGPRWGAAAVSAGVLGLAAAGLSVTQGWIVFDIDMNAYSVAKSSWLNAVLGCAFWSFLTAGCVGSSHRELVGALRTSQDRSIELAGSNERLRDLAARLVAAEDTERRRLATVLHDGIGQKLYAAKLRLGTMTLATGDPPSKNDFDEILRLIDDTIEHSRDLTQELSPQILYESGLAAAIEWLADEHRRLHGIDVTFETGPIDHKLADEAQLTAFQAVRELLHNIAKHAHARSVRLTLNVRDKRVEITVADDGVGFDSKDSSGGFGLFNISERLGHIGGNIEVRSRLCEGTTATIILPAAPSQRTS